MSETLAVLVLIALRVGVPLLVIFGLSFLAYRWIGEGKPERAIAGKSATADVQRAALGGPAPLAHVLYTGTRCCDVKGCSEEMKATCPAAARPELPCWLAVQMKTGHLRKNCFDCNFYERPTATA